MKLFYFILLAGMAMMFSACNNNSNEVAGAIDSDSSVYGMTGNDVKLVKTAGIEIKVENVEQASWKINTLARNFGGMLFHQGIHASIDNKKEFRRGSDSLLVLTSSTPKAELTVKLPASRLDSFLHQVASIGYFTFSSNYHVEDKSLVFLENWLRNDNRNLPALTAPKQVSKQTLNSIAVKDEAVHLAVQNLSINAASNFSTVMLSLSQNPVVSKEVVVNHHIGDLRLSAGERFLLAIEEGARIFIDLLITLTRFWALIVAGITIYLIYKRRMKFFN